MWHLMGVMLSAGGALRWYRDALCAAEDSEAARTGRDVYDLLTESAAHVPAGSEGLIFLPYLTGERTPHPDPDARGVFFGLSLRHGKAHMTRSVLEGVAYGLRDSLELMRSLGVSIERVRVSGGGARSAVWRQILADVLAAPLENVAVSEGAAYGAAILAGVGAGVFDTVASACESIVSATATTRPGPDRAIYEAHYPHYRSLYPALSDAFARIADPARIVG
jgi:xylulokinase